MYSVIASRYARALSDAASELGSTEQVERDLPKLSEQFNAVPELRRALVNPALPLSKKRELVGQLQNWIGIDDASRNFLILLLENTRFNLFDQIVEAFQEVQDRRRGIVRGEVYSSRILEASEKKRLLTILRSGVRGTQIDLKYFQDPSLIGGLKLKMGSMVFDGSIKAQLDELRKLLANL